MDYVLQDHLPNAPWMWPAMRRLPGVQPLDPAEWLQVDSAYAGQIALRTRLLHSRRTAVLESHGRPAEWEVRDEVLAWLARHGAGFQVGPNHVLCPDGRTVPLSDQPLADLAAIIQEDICLIERARGQAEHVLTAALLCFPASWTLAEKIGRPLTAIHAPVADYTPEMARRVQRLFDAVRVGRPLWRQNALIYANPTLFQPRREAAPRADRGGGYLRSERQSLWRLPKTGAVVFSIHTYLVPLTALDPAERAGLSTVAHVT